MESRTNSTHPTSVPSNPKKRNSLLTGAPTHNPLDRASVRLFPLPLQNKADEPEGQSHSQDKQTTNNSRTSQPPKDTHRREESSRGRGGAHAALTVSRGISKRSRRFEERETWPRSEVTKIRNDEDSETIYFFPLLRPMSL